MKTIKISGLDMGAITPTTEIVGINDTAAGKATERLPLGASISGINDRIQAISDAVAIKAEVSDLEAKIDKSSIAQTLGDSAEQPISQKAVSDALAELSISGGELSLVYDHTFTEDEDLDFTSIEWSAQSIPEFGRARAVFLTLFTEDNIVSQPWYKLSINGQELVMNANAYIAKCVTISAVFTGTIWISGTSCGSNTNAAFTPNLCAHSFSRSGLSYIVTQFPIETLKFRSYTKFIQAGMTLKVYVV